MPEEKQSAHLIFNVQAETKQVSPAPPPPLTGIPQRIHGFAAWLPAAESDVLPFVNRVQELDVYPLVHGLGIPEVSKILNRRQNSFNEALQYLIFISDME